jgi:hypothetical protein
MAGGVESEPPRLEGGRMDDEAKFFTQMSIYGGSGSAGDMTPPTPPYEGGEIVYANVARE